MHEELPSCQPEILNSYKNENNLNSLTISIPELDKDVKNIGNSSFKSTYKRTAVERRLLLLVSTAIIICCVLLIALVIVSYLYHRQYEETAVCKTSECFRSAAILMESMDRSVDPCDNFYKYACGNWKREHPLPESRNVLNYFTEVEDFLLRKVRGHLEQETSEDEPRPVSQAKMLYRSCMDEDSLDRVGLEPLYSILEDVELPVRPPIPSNETTQVNFNWIHTVVKVQRTTSLEMLIALDVRPANRNNSVFRIAIRKPGDIKPLPHLDSRVRNEKETKESKTGNHPLKRYIFEVMLRIYAKEPIEDFKNSIWRTAGEMLNLLHELNKIEEAAIDSDDDEVEMSIQELNKLTEINGTAQVNWTEYFSYMYEGIEIDSLNLTSDYKIVVKQREYFKSLAEIISETPPEILELTLWWKLVDLVIPYTDTYMREVNQRYTGALISRTMFCTKVVKSVLKMAVGYMMADVNFFQTTQRNVEDMVKNIRTAFYSMVKSVDWIDKPTKTATLEKVQDVNASIGFPDWILDTDELEDYYDGINEVEVNSSTFLVDLLWILETAMTDELLELGTEFSGQGCIHDPLEVNAYYGNQENDIMIPFGILLFPFYGLGLEALNYGNTGSTVGHELTHGFDNTGWKFDKSGNYRQWWSNSSIAEYMNKTDCFVKQFDQYEIEGIKVNGTLTLAENIADDGGLRAALLAYQTLVNKNGIEPKLPGFEDFTHEQLFFLAYANSWCENWTMKYLQNIADNVHAPQYFRVIGSVSNSDEFSRIWNCPKGSAMNPIREKCKIW